MKIIDGGYHPSKPTIAINLVTIFILVRYGFTSTEGVVVPVSLKTRQKSQKKKKAEAYHPKRAPVKKQSPDHFSNYIFPLLIKTHKEESCKELVNIWIK